MSKYTKLPQYSSLAQKLASYNQNGDCWEYNGCTNRDGYCLIMVDRKLQYAHRLAWEFHNKTKIPIGMTVDHICFNPRCINPAHLRLLSRQENNRRHKKTGYKMWCDKHGCKRKIKQTWSSKLGRTRTYSICPKCAIEHTKKYRLKKAT